MGVTRKLRRKSHKGRYKIEPLRQVEALPFRKMSEVLLDFAQPLLEDMDDDENDCFEAVINFAAICWNLSFLPEKEQRVQLKNIASQLGESDLLMRLEAKSLARVLLHRKKTLFSNDRRIIANVKIVGKGDNQRLLVMSALAKD